MKSKTRRLLLPPLILFAINFILRGEVFSGLAVVAIWFSTLYLFRWQISVLAPLLFVFEPGLDQINPFFTFLVFVACFLFYFAATRRQRLEKLLAYITLGFAAGIDISAVFLLPAFLVFVMISPGLVSIQYNPLSFFKSEIMKPQLTWLDAWGLVIGAGSYGLMNPNAWTPFRTDLPINATGQTLRMLGESLEGSAALLAVLFLMVCALVVYSEYKLWSNNGYHIAALICLPFLVSALSPHFLNNLISSADLWLMENSFFINPADFSTNALVAILTTSITLLVCLVFRSRNFADQELMLLFALLVCVINVFGSIPLLYLGAACAVWIIGSFPGKQSIAEIFSALAAITAALGHLVTKLL